MRASFAGFSLVAFCLSALGAACTTPGADDAPLATDSTDAAATTSAQETGPTTPHEDATPGPPRCTTPRPAPPAQDGGAAPGLDGGAADADADAGRGYFDRHPWASVVDQGGPVLASPHLVPVFFADDPLADDLERFVDSVGCTDYFRAIANEYGVGDALPGTTARLAEASPQHITTTELERWLVDELTAQVPRLERPTKDALYILFYGPQTIVEQAPGQVSCSSFGGYHTNVVLPDGTRVAYAVVPRCGEPALEVTTGAASHEIIEAATDPYNKDLLAYAYVDDAHASWMFVLGGEVADLCAQRSDAFYTPTDYPYMVQRSWSNRAARRGADPCVPPSGEPLFTAAFDLPATIDFGGGFGGRGVIVPPGESRTIDLELHDEGTGLISVTVDDVSTSLTGHVGASSLTLDRSRGRGGDVLHLTIKTPAGASDEPELFVVGLQKNGRYTYSDVGAIGH